jgi:hypothetical protein
VTTITTLHAGHDVRYLTSGDAHGGNAGAMRYYTASGEPPGQWAGKGAAALGLSGVVDGDVMERLYMLHVGPNGEMLTRPRGKAAAQDDDQVAMAFRAAHPFASEVEVAEAVAKAWGGAQVSVPYYDLTVSAAKSVSVLHASLKIAAQEAFTRGDLVSAGRLHAEADGIEADLEAAARFAVERAEAEACYTRTGHHSSTTGEWRDGAGLIASTFTHHISRDGDPQLHVHIAVANLVQRADGGDETFRQLDTRALHNQRLSIAAQVDREMESPDDRPGVCDGPARGRERLRGRRGLPAGHGPVLLPQGDTWHRGRQARGGVPPQVRARAVQADTVADGPAGSRGDAAAEGRGPQGPRDQRRRCRRRGPAGGVGDADRRTRDHRAVPGAPGCGGVRVASGRGDR